MGASLVHIIQNNGNLKFHSRHPTLEDIGKTFVSYNFPRLPKKEVNIYIGVHNFKNYSLRKGLNVGIQTEQLFDVNGKALWRNTSRLKILRQVSQYKMTLDLAPSNQPAYEFLPNFLKKRIIFGPDIFPECDISFRPYAKKELVFFGAKNLRRSQLIDSISITQIVRLLETATFCEQLSSNIQECAGILNIHYDDGVYTEIPRLITAYLNGKPVFSEELAHPLVAGKHYFPVNAAFDAIIAKQIFDRFKLEFVAKHKFSNFLNHIDEKFEIF